MEFIDIFFGGVNHLFCWCLSVRVLFYSPKRTLVDIAEVFLWLMAVGTILSASFWSAWTAKEAAQEHYRRMKVR